MEMYVGKAWHPGQIIRGELPLVVQPPKEEFKKYDTDKLDYALFPNSVLEGIIKVMMFGAKKYGRDNWMLCTDLDRYYNAARRHQEARRAGEYYDPETKLPHIFHELCNSVFIAYLEEKRKDDRKKEEKANTNIGYTTPATSGN